MGTVDISMFDWGHQKKSYIDDHVYDAEWSKFNSFDGIAGDFIQHFKNILSPDVIDSDLSHIQHTDCEILWLCPKKIFIILFSVVDVVNFGLVVFLLGIEGFSRENLVCSGSLFSIL